MSLPWVRLDTGFPRDPKVLALLAHPQGHRAGFVYLCGLAYCGEQGTDGFVPVHALPFLHARTSDAAKLVEVGLWTACPGGWLMPTWADYQQTAKVTEITRSSRRAAALKANCVRWHGKRCRCSELESESDRVADSAVRILRDVRDETD